MLCCFLGWMKLKTIAYPQPPRDHVGGWIHTVVKRWSYFVLQHNGPGTCMLNYSLTPNIHRHTSHIRKKFYPVNVEHQDNGHLGSIHCPSSPLGGLKRNVASRHILQRVLSGTVAMEKAILHNWHVAGWRSKGKLHKIVQWDFTILAWEFEIHSHPSMAKFGPKLQMKYTATTLTNWGV